MGTIGRPRRGAEIGADALITIRVPSVLKERLRNLAEHEHRSLTQQIIHLVERELAGGKR